MDRFRGADTGYHIFPLGIDHIFTKETVFSGGRISRKCYTGGAVVAHVSKNHCADIDRSAISHIFGDFEFLSVINGPFPHPRLEDRFHGQFQLYIRVLWKRFACLLLDKIQEFIAHRFKSLGIKLNIFFYFTLFLDLIEYTVKIVIINVECNGPEKLDQPAIEVIHKTFILGKTDKSGNRLIVEAKVQDGIHHAGHGHGRSRPDRDQ